MLALDRFYFDRDSRLHLSCVALSKAGVSRYRGREIQHFERLGLDARREYRLLRDPAELRRAAASLSGLPLLSDHVAPTTSLSFPRALIVGALGTDAYLDRDLRLRTSMTIWTRPAIDGVKSNTKRQLSLGSRFALDMTPGSFLGERYDGIMRDIEGHHAALVHRGRCGSDCGITISLNNVENLNERVFAA